MSSLHKPHGHAEDQLSVCLKDQQKREDLEHCQARQRENLVISSQEG